MILAEAVSGEEGAELLARLVELKPEKGREKRGPSRAVHRSDC